MRNSKLTCYVDVIKVLSYSCPKINFRHMFYILFDRNLDFYDSVMLEGLLANLQSS